MSLVALLLDKNSGITELILNAPWEPPKTRRRNADLSFVLNSFLTLKIFVRNGLPVKIGLTERANVLGYASNT